MSLPGELMRRVAMLLRGARVDRELAEEMRTHVELREAQLREQGRDAEAARHDSRRRFGNATRLGEEAIDAWGWRWLEQLGQDLTFGWRTLRKQPVFAIAAVSTLALGIGATTSIFSVVNGVLLRPLPFEDPDRLVQVYGRAWAGDRGGVPDPLNGPIGFSELDAYTAGSTSFVGFAGYAVNTRHADAGTGVERLKAVVADQPLFDLLGVE
ncbi:MAG: permease prefix domain 1-containing protein, partial [Burkholderiales bacterium]